MRFVRSRFPLRRVGLLAIPLALLLIGQDGCTEEDADGDGYTPSNGDCDDRNPNTYPGAPEICDGEDNDCDRDIDEGLDQLYYADVDGDGFGVEDQTTIDCAVPNGYAEVAGDCDDRDPAINPGAQDVCDGIDNDCDGALDEAPETSYYPDEDGDGFGDESAGLPSCEPVSGLIDVGGDCNDADSEVHPGVADICDAMDNDCDGAFDEDPEKLWSVDEDGDGFGTLETAVIGCTAPETLTDTAGMARWRADTVDLQRLVPEVTPGPTPGVTPGPTPGVTPGPTLAPTPEPTWAPTPEPTWAPTPEPTWAPTPEPTWAPSPEPTLEPTPEPTPADTPDPTPTPLNYVDQFGDCDDADARVYPGAPDICDGLDNDCDARVDEGRRYFVDADGDGFGVASTSMESCETPSGLVEASGDCDDGDSSIYPGAEDVDGDGIDGDCGGGDGPQPNVGLGGPSAVGSIQAALEAAAPGDVIWVGAGHWLASGLSFGGKAMTLMSTDGPESTVIDGRYRGSIFVFDNGETTGSILSGFTLTGGLGVDGGAVRLESAGASLDNLYIWGNRASAGGGALGLMGGATVEVTGSTLTGNIVLGSDGSSAAGGAMALDASTAGLQSSVLFNNLAGGDAALGGGIASLNGTLGLASTWILRNQALGDAGFGGGVWASDGVLVLEDSSVSGNTSASDGGGVYVNGTLLSGTSSLVADNTASRLGGGLYLASMDTTLTNFNILGNLALTGGGAGISLDSTTLTLNQSVVADNAADNLAGIGAGGGGILVVDSTLELDHCLLAGNYASPVGGGVAAFSGTTVSVTYGRMMANNAEASGGAMHLAGAVLSMERGVLTDNHAEDGGGLFLTEEANATVNNSILAYNTSHNILLNNAGPNPDSTGTATYSDLYNDFGYLNHNLPDFDSTINSTSEPKFLSYTEEGLPMDLHLATDSSMINAGTGAVDADGSSPDIGAFGGPQGNAWDLDADLAPNYFWPGTIFETPSGVDGSAFDCDDLDASIQACTP